MYKISGRSENVQMCNITLCRRSVYDHLAAAGNEIINVIEQTQKTSLEEQTKVLIEERLVAAACEILDGFEIVIREYQQDIDRNRLLNVILKPFIKLHRADARSLHSVCQEERPPDQEVSEPPPIKDEQEEMLICPEGEQLAGLEDVDGKLNLNAVPVKSEDDEEDRLSLFDPTQHLDSRDVTASTEEIKTAHEEDCGATELEPSNECLHPSYCSENEMEEVDIKLNLNAVPVKSEDYEEDRLSLFDPTQHLDSRNVTTSAKGIKTAHEEDCGATELEPSNKCLLPSSYCSENEMEEVDIKLNLNAVPMKSEDYEEDRLSLFDPTQHLDSRNVTTATEEIKTAHEEDCGATELEPSNKCLLPSSYRSENEMEEVDIKLNLNAVPVNSEDYEEDRLSLFDPTQHFDSRNVTTSTIEIKTAHEEDCGATELEPSNECLLPSSYCSENEMDVSEDYDDWNDSRPSGSELSMQKQSGKDKPCPSTISQRLRSMEPSNPSSLDCKVCRKFCPNSMTLMRHVKIHSTECGLCGKHLKSGVNLKMHIEVHKQCIVCSKICSSISGLERHMRSHTGEKLFSCTLCEKRFIQSSSLKRHMTSHDSKRSFTCTSCNKAFKQSGSLKTHMRIHTGEKPFKCTECDNCFSTKASLNQHIRVHTGERPFSCTLCEKRFTQRVSLNLHRTTHTGEKPFKCTLCEKGFSQKVSLKTHMTTHTGEKPFKCTLCEKGFSQKVSLKTHMTTHTGEKPFKCTLCEKGFSQRVGLKGHMTTHSGIRPFKCTL